MTRRARPAPRRARARCTALGLGMLGAVLACAGPAPRAPAEPPRATRAEPERVGAEPSRSTEAELEHARVVVEELGDGDGALRVRLFRPAATGPFPAVVLLHGFMRSGERFTNHGRRLAERGVVTLVPDLESLLRPGARERNVERVVAWLQDLDARADVDGTRVALAGHSAGGALALQAAVVARERGLAVAGLCLLDAVPWRETVAAAERLRGVPVASFTSEPSAGNAHGSTARIHAALAPADLVHVRVVGASHVDPEGPTDALGALFGGGADPARQARYAELLVSWLGTTLAAPGVRPGAFAERVTRGVQLGELRLEAGAPAPR